MKSIKAFSLSLLFLFPLIGKSQNSRLSAFEALDVFELEWASEPQIAPDASQIVYRRNSFDIMSDKAVGNLWILNTDGSNHRKLSAREGNEYGAKWSPDGKRIAFISSTDQGSELYMYWMESGQLAKLSHLKSSPSSLIWSKDGQQLFFTQFVATKAPVLIKMPPKPRGAKWADPARITDRLKHEADGRGYMPTGFTHVFSIPAEGGTPRQLTSGDFNHRGPLSVSSDGQSVYFSANRNTDWEYDFRNSEVYRVDVATGVINALTDRQGPDRNPVLGPNGNYIAYLSYADKRQAHQLTQLHLMGTDGAKKRLLSGSLDRSVGGLKWDAAGKGLYFSYDDKGNTKVGYINLEGEVSTLVHNVGGTSIGRPYGGGSFSLAKNGSIAFTKTRPNYPADVAVIKKKANSDQRITQLNADVLNHRALGKTEEVWYTSSFDGRPIQGWIVKPPFYDASKKYPLLVENHGGPISNYGDRFSAEMQLYAAAGYLVFYPNPRGSTSYGEDFANQLYHNYPGEDYNDVMDGVDHLIEKGLAHEESLYVTGGSAGGIMTAWIIGKNNRFKAAVVAKPVVNWISKTLVADNYFGYANSRYPGQPWENFETYWNFSPLSLVGNIETPTMVMVGMSDLRTPPSEAKQLYHALKLRKIETVLVELPGASHGIAKRPSQLISKIAHTVAWFNQYK